MKRKRVFTAAEKWAIFSLHGARCYIQGEPINFMSMEVDHIIPERLLNVPAELADVLTLLGLPSSFEINSFENWLPACGPCNRKKSSTIFRPTPMIDIQLQRAKSHAHAALALADQIVSDKKVGDALATLERAATRADMPIEKLKPLIELFLGSHPTELRAMVRDLEARRGQLSRFELGRQTVPTVHLELRLTDFAKIVYYPGRAELVAA